MDTRLTPDEKTALAKLQQATGIQAEVWDMAVTDDDEMPVYLIPLNW